MNILIIGGGGREHAIAWKLKQSPKVSTVYIAPGNAGTKEIGENINITIKNHDEVLQVIKEKNIEFVIVTPDDVLASGLVDYLETAGIKAFGPTKAAAKIEWSKSFAKELMMEECIPTARFSVFTEYEKAKEYIKKQSLPIVIKADGLALGKGVIIAQTLNEAEKALKKIMLEKTFGKAGNEIVIEEYLEGQEISIHVFCDGETAILFPPSQDHKQIYDGGVGPNTGGMGTIAPVPWVTDTMMKEISEKIVNPVLAGLKKRGRIFKGVLYPGLIITKDGPKVIEFNARFGDPETQSYMRLLKSDLLDILLGCTNGNLSNIPIEWSDKHACCITLASGGYPGLYKKGVQIKGIKNAEKGSVFLFHAGTKSENNKIVTNGGRVLSITAIGNALDDALSNAYDTIDKIHFESMQFRKDIGKSNEPSVMAKKASL